uniref:Uncharacterized protein n=1 Tax=Timema tahoe TaxID=61484 RepID=A0A7R9FN46_9NEOP|nr:unnamed protein product [Timema tahoe]
MQPSKQGWLGHCPILYRLSLYLSLSYNPQVDGDSAPNKRRIAARLGKLFSARARSPSPLTGSPTPPLSPRYKESSSSLFVYNTPPRSPTKTPPPVAAPNGARKKVVQFRRRLSETSPEEVEERRAGIVRSQTEVFTFDRPANRRLVDRTLPTCDVMAGQDRTSHVNAFTFYSASFKDIMLKQKK